MTLRSHGFAKRDSKSFTGTLVVKNDDGTQVKAEECGHAHKHSSDALACIQKQHPGQPAPSLREFRPVIE